MRLKIGMFYYMNITFQYIALEISFRESLTTFVFLMLYFFINEMFFKKPKTLCRHVFFSEFLCFNLFYIKWDEKHKAIKISHKVRKSLPMYSAITQDRKDKKNKVHNGDYKNPYWTKL